MLKEAVLTKIVNRAFRSGDAYIADGQILLKRDLDESFIINSSSLPSLSRNKDAPVQTISEHEDHGVWVKGLDTCFQGKKSIPPKRTYSSIQLHRPYRVSPKTKPAPPPPPPPLSSPLPPPIPPPPPSKSPQQFLDFLDQQSCFSYGYTSPISTLTLSLGTFDSASCLPSPPSFAGYEAESPIKIKPYQDPKTPRKKKKAPSPPLHLKSIKAWKLIPVSKDIESSSDEDSPRPTLTLYSSSSEREEDLREGSPTLYILSPQTRPGTPRQSTPRPDIEYSSCDTESSQAYSIVSLTRPPSYLFKFQKTIDVRVIKFSTFSLLNFLFVFKGTGHGEASWYPRSIHEDYHE